MSNKGIVLNPNKILIAMANQNLSVSDLCKNADIFNGTYRRIMQCESVKPKTAGKIAKALNTKVEDLLED